MTEIYKTLEDVERVIALGKPQVVIDKFVDSYLSGVAAAPYIAAEEEYSTLKAQEDQPDVEALRDPDTGEVVTEGYSPNSIRDARVAELEAEFPYLATEDQTRPDLIVDVAAWKIAHYAELRRPRYPNPEDYLDAWVKGDAEAMEEYREKCLEVKALFPKE